jgi:hypothetical protein
MRKQQLFLSCTYPRKGVQQDYPLQDDNLSTVSVHGIPYISETHFSTADYRKHNKAAETEYSADRPINRTDNSRSEQNYCIKINNSKYITILCALGVNLVLFVVS